MYLQKLHLSNTLHWSYQSLVGHAPASVLISAHVQGDGEEVTVKLQKIILKLLNSVEIARGSNHTVSSHRVLLGSIHCFKPSSCELSTEVILVKLYSYVAGSMA